MADLGALSRPLGTPPAYQPDSVLEARAAPRRLVLVGPDGALEVLGLVPAASLHAELRRQAAAHPGRTVAGEWLSPRGWVRFIEATWDRLGSPSGDQAGTQARSCGRASPF